MFKIVMPITLWLALSTCALLAGPPVSDAERAKIDAEDPLTPEAEKIVDELRDTLENDSEALAMLENILDGSKLGPEDGWFPLAKSKTRFDWNYVFHRYDADEDRVIQAKEFDGSQADFARLDRNGNGVLDEADFDWSKNSLSGSPGGMLFSMTDRDGNGKVTEEEFVKLFHSLAGEQSDFVALDDLRDLLQPPAPAPPNLSSPAPARPDRPSRSTLVVSLKSQELGSLQPGPRLNQTAPDFTLPTLDGQEVTLSKVVGDKPIVLIFGNFTCGPFRSQSGNIEKLTKRYQDRAHFYLVYVREAHPATAGGCRAINGSVSNCRSPRTARGGARSRPLAASD